MQFPAPEYQPREGRAPSAYQPPQIPWDGASSYTVISQRRKPRAVDVQGLIPVEGALHVRAVMDTGCLQIAYSQTRVHACKGYASMHTSVFRHAHDVSHRVALVWG